MPPDPPTVSGLQPSVSQGTCPLTSQCPSTSKVNENPGHANGVAKQANNIIIIIHVKVVKFVFNKGSSLLGFQEKWFFLSYSPLNHNLLF